MISHWMGLSGDDWGWFNYHLMGWKLVGYEWDMWYVVDWDDYGIYHPTCHQTWLGNPRTKRMCWWENYMDSGSGYFDLFCIWHFLKIQWGKSNKPKGSIVILVMITFEKTGWFRDIPTITPSNNLSIGELLMASPMISLWYRPYIPIFPT